MGLMLKETIKELTRTHLVKNRGMLLGQSISAVGWVNGTVPDCENIIELPMCDVAGSGIAVGAALSGRRPILVIRFQDFVTLGMSPIVNYAAKAKEFFGVGVPILVRLIADEGKGLGPVHSGKFHGLFLQFPGLKICTPITPNEYTYCWNQFMSDDCPYIFSEHRASYENIGEIMDHLMPEADITLYGVSIARMNLQVAQQLLYKEGIKCNVFNILWLKPLRLSVFEQYFKPKFGLVVDTGFENGGTSEHIAYKIMTSTKQKVEAFGLKDYSVGCTPETYNLTPSPEQIVDRVKNILGE
jgi:pyruvate/2-oxoglutarate/acetoin dehydrogenase E1 component